MGSAKILALDSSLVVNKGVLAELLMKVTRWEQSGGFANNGSCLLYFSALHLYIFSDIFKFPLLSYGDGWEQNMLLTIENNNSINEIKRKKQTAFCVLVLLNWEWCPWSPTWISYQIYLIFAINLNQKLLSMLYPCCRGLNVCLTCQMLGNKFLFFMDLENSF